MSPKRARAIPPRRQKADGTATRPRGLASAYWLVPLLLSVVQWRASVTGMHEIRYEELAESVRSVFWLDRHLVYDGVYSNVGWYGTLLVVYKIFGFSLVQAKFVRLALHLAGLQSVAALLVRLMSWRVALVPLVLIGLSPTWLYLDTLQTSYGLDLSYGAMCLYLLSTARLQSPAWPQLTRTFFCGAIAMVAAMSYPTFFCYIPALLLVGIWLATAELVPAGSSGGWRWHVLSGGVGLALPLAAAFAFVRTPRLLLYDPETQAGLFRGGGQMHFGLATLKEALGTTMSDLFVRGQSYYFEVSRPEFAGVLAIAGLTVVIGTAVYVFVTNRGTRAIIAGSVLLAATSVVLASLSTGSSIRRCTGLLAAYFALFAVAWHYYATSQTGPRWLRRAGMVLCLLLPLSNALGLSALFRDLADESIYRNADWFAVESTPDESLAHLLANMDKGQALSCPIDQDGRITPCRYQEVYAAMAGSLEWNAGRTPDIRALDWRTGRPITLTPSLWADHYYPTCTRLEACR